MNKMVKKQLERYGLHEGKDALLLFKVRFFVADCHKLNQEITR